MQGYLTPHLSGQDPDAWCDLSKFDLPEEPSAEDSSSSSPVQPQPSEQQVAPPSQQPAAPGPSVTEYRLDGPTISDLSRGSRGELIPISPSTEVRGLGIGTPPSVLKRQKKRRVTLSPVTENSSNLSFLDSCNSLTPKSTPVKTLPFSPSQVCAPPCRLLAGFRSPSTGPGMQAGTYRLTRTHGSSAVGEGWGEVVSRNGPGPTLMKLTFWQEDQLIKKKTQMHIINGMKEKAYANASRMGGRHHPGRLP